MDPEELKRLRADRYNDWGKRQPLDYANPEQNDQAFASVRDSRFSLIVKSIIFMHELTNCRGFEFVAFSNAKIDRPVKLPYGVILYPCFLPEVGGTQKGDTLAAATMRMQRAAKYVYDGWVPIKDFDDVAVRQALRHLSEALSIFSLTTQSHFEWGPKYSHVTPFSSTHQLTTEDIDTLETFASVADSLNDADRTAIFCSIAWLAEARKVDDVKSTFLFTILAVESLVTYIEQKAEANSSFASLRTLEIPPKMNPQERADCVRSVIEGQFTSDPVQAVTEAYKHCVNLTPSIGSILKSHITKLMSEHDDGVLLFFQEQGGLYKLRHKIAHGGLNNLDVNDVMQIEKKIRSAEKFALRYVWTVLQKCLHFYNRSGTLSINNLILMENCVMPNSTAIAYKGPTDMGIIYTS